MDSVARSYAYQRSARRRPDAGHRTEDDNQLMREFLTSQSMAAHQVLAAEFLSQPHETFSVRVLNMPPRFGKTFLAQNLIADLNSRGLTSLYVAHSDTVARMYGGKATFCRGFDGAALGRRFDVVILDDVEGSHRHSKGASKRMKDYLGTVPTWLNLRGLLVCIESRCGPDDVSSILLKLPNVGHLVIPAVDKTGKSFWPGMWTSKQLAENRAILGEDEWQRKWMQEVAV